MELLKKVVLGGANWWAGRLKEKANSNTADYRQHIAGVRRKAPPLAIKLSPMADPSWLQEFTPARRSVGTFTKCGFVQAGCFALVGMPQWQLAGFVNADQFASATLLKSGDTLQTSLGTFFTDGSLFTVTDAPDRPGQAFPPWFDRKRFSGQTVAELIEKFFAMRPNKPSRVSSVETYAAGEEAAFSQMQAWFAERGGATREEIVDELQAAGKLPEESGQEVFLTNLRLFQVEKAAWNWLKLQADLSFPLENAIEWLAIVHDEMPVGDVATTYWSYSGDYGVRESQFADGSPRLAFARVNTARGNKLQKVMIKETGLPMDFYLPTN